MHRDKSVVFIFLFVAFHFTSVDSICRVQTANVTACIRDYANVNKEATNNAGDNSCPVDKLKNSCTSFRTLSKCLGKDGRSRLCDLTVRNEFSKKGLECSYKEIEDVLETCGASFNYYSVFSLAMVVLLSRLYQHVK